MQCDAELEALRQTILDLDAEGKHGKFAHLGSRAEEFCQSLTEETCTALREHVLTHPHDPEKDETLIHLLSRDGKFVLLPLTRCMGLGGNLLI